MLKKFLLALSVLAVLSSLIYRWITSLPKIEFDDSVKVNARTGEKIFWGKGRCHVCHRIGERGYALRGPNLGESKDGTMIPVRAQQRASELGLANGTAYLVQSIAEPGSFVVPGYNNEMPEVFKAPIYLSPPEIKAVVLYLESLDGDTAFQEIQLPEQLLAAYGRPQKKIDLKGDVEAGRALFFDLEGPAACAACHVGLNASAQPEGRTIGPDLTAIASFRTPEHILQKIVKPYSNIVSGYENSVIKTELNTFIVGIIKQESSQTIVLRTKDNKNITLEKSRIRTITRQPLSMMPNNYTDLLSENQMDDLMAYLLTLQGK